eukprot:m51a1_g5637 hypothetical protein (307) ;mRNA; f:835495-836486
MADESSWDGWSMFDPATHTAAHPSATLVAGPSPDHGVAKLVLREGRGDPVADGDKVNTRYEARIAGSEEHFDRTARHSFLVGAGEVLPAWDAALRGARAGERLLVWSAPEFAFGALGCPPRVPGGASLLWEVDVLGVERAPPRTGQVVTPQQRLEEARRARGSGNSFFKQNALRKAIAAYKRGLGYLTTCDSPGELAGEFKAERALLQLNKAACHIKRKEWSAAIVCLDDAVACDPQSAKAHYRLAQALDGQNEVESALEHASEALRIDPASSEARALCSVLQKRVAEQRRNNPWRGMFSRDDAAN